MFGVWDICIKEKMRWTEIFLAAPNKRCYSKDVHILCHFAVISCIVLIGALLHLDQREIINSIMPGEQIDNKTFVLDINVVLNNNICLNLEMQVVNPSNWQDRSLSYLCRMYDRLHHGEDYKEAGRAIHIGILDFTLFEEVPEFYACYKLLNVKNHNIFNENFVLNVLDLNRIDLATDEDRRYEIDRWAKMFKADT